MQDRTDMAISFEFKHVLFVVHEHRPLELNRQKLLTIKKSWLLKTIRGELKDPWEELNTVKTDCKAAIKDEVLGKLCMRT